MLPASTFDLNHKTVTYHIYNASCNRTPNLNGAIAVDKIVKYLKINIAYLILYIS